jgi:UDP-N-acetyl-D-glucosamine dehydrogenase
MTTILSPGLLAAGSAVPFEALARRIEQRTATVAVVGLGYVGLPLLAQFDAAGFSTIGFDVDALRVASLARGESTTDDLCEADITRLRSTFSRSPSVLGLADVLIVCVPTPLRDGGPDTSLIAEAMRTVARNVVREALVILESTTYPGTTEELVVPILEAEGLRIGQDVALAYAPERVDPGTGRDISRVPRVVGGIDAVSGDLAEATYRSVVDDVYRVRHARDAEMAKLIENTFRQVNIALVNELATVAHSIGVDIWAALDAAATKPFGYMPFFPGPGVGGHCIAVDPSYLSWRVEQQLGYGLGFVQHARTVNNRMPSYVVDRVRAALDRFGSPLRGTRVHCAGVAYKPGVSDVRESPAHTVLELLHRAGARVSFSDPLVEAVELGGVRFERSDAEDAELIVLLAATPADVSALALPGRHLFDAQGVTRHLDLGAGVSVERL